MYYKEVRVFLTSLFNFINFILIKTYLFKILVVFLLLSSCNNNIPRKIKSNFLFQYAHAKDVEWTITSNHSYQVTFYITQFNYLSVLYDASGKIIREEREVFEGEIPMSMVAQLKNLYPNTSIYNVYKCTSDKYQSYIFEFVANGTLQGVEFYNDSTHKVIPSTAKRFTSVVDLDDVF